MRAIVIAETQVAELGELLEETIAGTKMQVQKKQSRTKVCSTFVIS